MPFTPSSALHNGHPYLHEAHPVDDVAKEVMARLATQAMQMAANGFHLAMQDLFEDEEGEALDDADDEDTEQ